MKFHICFGVKEEVFSKEVESYLKKGYKLHGQIFLMQGQYSPELTFMHQAVVKGLD